MRAAESGRLPLGIITGFLGSGKTTLLNRLLRDPGLADSVVLVNELGEIGLDHWLLARLDADTVLLPSGCVCCTVRAELRDALLDLWERRQRGLLPPFRRVLMETTGLADPAPIARTLAADPRLRHHYELGGIITVVDALTGARTIAEHEEALRQIAAADLLVLAKADLAGEAEAAAVEQQLAALNPAAARHRAGERRAPDQAVRLLREGSAGGPALPMSVEEHLTHHGISALCLSLDEPLDWAAFALWFTLLLHRHGQQVLRSKGILHLKGVPTPVVVHGVQHVVHRPSHLPAWPEEQPRTRLVLIGKDLPRDRLERSFRLFMQLDRGVAAAGADTRAGCERGVG